MPDESIVEFLVTSNGYARGKWIGLPPRRRAEIVGKIVGKKSIVPEANASATTVASGGVASDEATPSCSAAAAAGQPAVGAAGAGAGAASSEAAPFDGLNEVLATQDYPEAFAELRSNGNAASDEEIVEFLLTSNGYSKDRWFMLSSRRRAEIIAKVTRKPIVTPFDGLNEVLATQDYPEAFAKLRSNGNAASDEEIVEFLLTSNGYSEDRWFMLSSRRQAEIIAKVTKKPVVVPKTTAYASLIAAGSAKVTKDEVNRRRQVVRREAQRRKIDGLATGEWWGYPRNPAAARALNDALIAQGDCEAMNRMVEGISASRDSRNYGYERSLPTARELNDQLVTLRIPGAIHRKMVQLSGMRCQDGISLDRPLFLESRIYLENPEFARELNEFILMEDELPVATDSLPPELFGIVMEYFDPTGHAAAQARLKRPKAARGGLGVSAGSVGAGEVYTAAAAAGVGRSAAAAASGASYAAAAAGAAGSGSWGAGAAGRSR